VKVAAAPARGMVAVKGDLADEALQAAARDAAGTEFPEPGQAVAGTGALLWMAPDELLVLVGLDARGAALAGLRRMAEGRHVLVEDVSDMRAGFVLEGAAVRDVLARVTPADVSPVGLPAGRVRRTRAGQVAAALWLPEEGRAELLCFRSVAAYVSELLEEAAASEPLLLYHVNAGG
jgi:sarcosine oxidase, subunit gamma